MTSPVPLPTPPPPFGQLTKYSYSLMVALLTTFVPGVNAGSSTPEELATYLRAEVAKWAKTIKAAGIPIN